MLVMLELMLVNICVLFNSVNYDIIFCMLIMVVVVIIVSVILVFLMVWYMVCYISGKMKVFFYIVVMLLMWVSYIVKVYVWMLLLVKDGVV